MERGFFQQRETSVTESRLSMNKILVPIQQFSWLSLSASYFAIEFAKRSPTKIQFLIFAETCGEEKGPASSKKKEEPWRRQFDGLIQQAREEKIELELFFSNEKYLEGVSQFARDHNTARIIIALPQVQDTIYDTLIQDVNFLRSQLENQIVIIKPKEERSLEGWKTPESGSPPSTGPGTFLDKKGS